MLLTTRPPYRSPGWYKGVADPAYPSAVARLPFEPAIAAEGPRSAAKRRLCDARCFDRVLRATTKTKQSAAWALQLERSIDFSGSRHGCRLLRITALTGSN
jgi:hypothetical protein